MAGPGASALLKTDASEYAALRSAARVGPGQPVGRGYAVEVAYRVAAYAQGTAKVDIVTEGPGNSGVTGRLSMSHEGCERAGGFVAADRVARAGDAVAEGNIRQIAECCSRTTVRSGAHWRSLLMSW